MRTTISTLSNAELCRQQGWHEGSILEGETHDCEGRRVSIRIRITAIGERAILARMIMLGGIWLHGAADELVYDLHGRDWEKV